MTRQDRTNFVIALVLLAGLAVALRIIHLVLQSKNLPFLGHPMIDAALYDTWARAIAAGRPFGGNGPFYHSPGYAYVLGSVYKIFGPSPMAAILVQSVLGVGTVVLCALLGRRLFGPQAGIIAGILVVASAPFYFFEAKLLDATVSVFLSTLAIFAALHPRKGDKDLVFIFAAGVAGGLLGVVRANLLLVPVLILIIWLWQLRSRRRALPEVSAYAAGALIALLPTFVHNLERGAFVPVATQGGFNFYLGNARGATGVFTDLPGVTTGLISTQEAEADSLVKADLGHVLPPGKESAYWTRRTLHEIAADPGHWFRLVAKRSWLYMNRQEENENGSLELEKEHVWVLRAACVPFNLLFVLALVGGIIAFRKRAGLESMAVPWALVLATFLTCIFFFVITRLRLPAVPILAVFSGYAAVEALGFWRSGRRVPVTIATILVVGITALTWNSPLGAPRNPAWEASLVIEGAKAFEKQGKSDRAKSMFALASRINPVSVDALLGEAEEAMRAGQVDRTLSLYERARDIAPERFAIHNNLGILYFSVGRMDDAEREMKEAVRLDPRAPAPYSYLIQICNGSGRSEEAEEWREKARQAGVELSGP